MWTDFAQPHTPDPIGRLADAMFYALAGDADRARLARLDLAATIADQPADAPLSQRVGSIAVLEVRQLYALGDLLAAERALARLLSGDASDPSLAALATLALPDGDAWAEIRLQTGTPGQRADAGCDLAWRRLWEGDEAGARAAIDGALQVCPGHTEAAWWRRFCDDHRGQLVPVFVRARTDPTAPGALDLAQLVPRQGNGWYSPVRLDRRVLARCPDPAPRPGSALQRLVDDGVSTRVFATDGDYAAMPDDHPLVQCEAALDLALALEVERRDIRPALQRTWTLAHATDDIAVSDASNALVAMGMRVPEAADLALAAAQHLCDKKPGETLWQSYRAALLATAGQHDDAVQLTATTVASLPLDPVSLQLLISALRTAGAHDRAASLLRRARQDPQLAGAARYLEENPDLACMTMVSDRMRPRFALGQERRP